MTARKAAKGTAPVLYYFAMPIHREGYSTLAVIGTVVIAVNGAALIFLPHPVVVLLVAMGVVVLIFLAMFFRNPQRVTPKCESCVVAPADGKIVAIEPTSENEYFHDQRLKLSIYMSAFNVHLNRVPINGKVIYQRYHPGRYLVAFHPKASELNERNTVVLEQADGQRVLMRQIAGLLARRIRYYLNDGQTVRAGDELGFIKFGSRCDVFLPLDAGIQVQLGQIVKGGETILAELRFEKSL